MSKIASRKSPWPECRRRTGRMSSIELSDGERDECGWDLKYSRRFSIIIKTCATFVNAITKSIKMISLASAL